MRKPALCTGKNKGADQLHGNHAADQRLCFRNIDSAIHLLPKSKISSLKPSFLAVQPSLCRTWSEPPRQVFSRCSPFTLSILHNNHQCLILQEILIVLYDVRVAEHGENFDFVESCQSLIFRHLFYRNLFDDNQFLVAEAMTQVDCAEMNNKTRRSLYACGLIPKLREMT